MYIDRYLKLLLTAATLSLTVIAADVIYQHAAPPAQAASSKDKQPAKWGCLTVDSKKILNIYEEMLNKGNAQMVFTGFAGSEPYICVYGTGIWK
jgi:hypothetical protein